MTSLPPYCSADEAAEIYNRTQLAASSYAASWLDSEVIGDLRPFFLGLGSLPPYCSTAEYNEYINALKARQTVVQSEYFTNRLPLDLLAAIQSWTTYDFLATPSLPVGATFTRPSTAWGFDSTGTRVSFANDAPRFSYSIGGVYQGLLNEPAATNITQNANANGAVVGSPGTFPTTWGVTGLTGTMATSVVAFGVVNGIQCVDVRFFGVPASGTAIQFAMDSAFRAGLAPGPVSMGGYIALVGGSFTNVTKVAQFIANNISNLESVDFRASISATLVKLTSTATAPAGTTGGIPRWIFRYTGTPALDFTMRFGLPQLEINNPTSSIVTTAGPVTRAVETLTLPLPAATYPAIYVTRQTGTTAYANQVVGGGGWVVPNDVSHITKIVAVSP